MSKDLDAADVGRLIVFGGIGLWIYFAFSGPDTPEKRPITHVATAGEELRPLGPDARDPFVEIATRHRDAYRKTGNGVEKGVIRKERGEALCRTFDSRFFEQWPGKLVGLSTTSDGQEVDLIRVELESYGGGDDVTIEDDTRYEPGTLMHETLLNEVAAGDAVTVSGEFRYDTDDDISDCFYERSITLSGGMTDPDYSATFSSVRPLDTGAE